ncbi:MAG: peptidoglycan-binding protein [Candidatus Gracilibacteria bacterium]|nr:peptidoglycan-binding protein [Candidatus Gracilibacteria bacterium]
MEAQSSENSQIKDLKSKIKIDGHLTKQERDVLQESYKKNEALVIDATKNELKSFISQDYGNANKVLLGGFDGIVKLQKKLGVKNDGDFGSETFNALIKFQKENGLTTDGLAGTETQIKLGLIPSKDGTIQNKTNITIEKNDLNTQGIENNSPSQVGNDSGNHSENIGNVEEKSREKDRNTTKYKSKNNEQIEKNTFDIYKKRLETIRKNLIDGREDILKNYKKTGLGEKAMDSVVGLFGDNVKKTYEDLIKRNNSQALSFLKSFILKYDKSGLNSEQQNEISILVSDIKNISSNNTLDDLSISDMSKNSVDALPETGKLALKGIEGLTVGFFEGAWNAVKSIPDFIKLLGNLTLYIGKLSIDSKTRDELITRCDNIIERVKKLDSSDYDKVLKMFQVGFDNFSKLPPEEQAKNIGKLFGNIEAIIGSGSLVKTAGVAIEANGAIKTGKILRIAGDLMSLKSSKVGAGEDFIKTLEYGKKFYFTYENGQTAEAIYMGVSNVGHHIKVAGEEGLRVIEFGTAEAQMFGSKLDQITNMLVKSGISKGQELIPESIIKFFSHEINLPGGEVIMKNLKLGLETTKNISKEQLLALIEKINSIQAKFAEIVDLSKVQANKIKDMINLSLKEINTFLTSINFSGLSNELQKSITDSFDKIKKKYNEIEDIIKNKYSELTEKSTGESIKGTGSKDFIKKLDKINMLPVGDSLVLHTKNSTYILKKGENGFILTDTTNIELKKFIGKEFHFSGFEGKVYLENPTYGEIKISNLESFETKKITQSGSNSNNFQENHNEAFENEWDKFFKKMNFDIKNLVSGDSLVLNTKDFSYILEKTENGFILKDTNNPEISNSIGQKIQFFMSSKGEILLKNQDKKVKLSELLSFEKKQKFNQNMNTAGENLPKLTETEIKEFKKKIRSLFMKYHPDKNAQESEKIKDIYTEIIKEINLVNEKLEKGENMIADYNKLISETIPNYERKINELKKPKSFEARNVFRSQEVMSVGDLHGNIDALWGNLYSLGVIDGNKRWIGGNRKLVFTGDILADRNTEGLHILKEIENLQIQAKNAGGDITVLAGNHDDIAISFLMGRSPGGYEGVWQRFGNQAEGIKEFEKFLKRGGNMDAKKLLAKMRKDPEGIAVLNNMCNMKVAEKIDDTLFVHTDITDKMANLIATMGIDEINRIFQGGLRKVLLEGENFENISEKFSLIADTFLHTNNRDYMTHNSGAMLKQMGINNVIHGHSDRRGKSENIGGVFIRSIDNSYGKVKGYQGSGPSTITIDRKGNLKAGEKQEVIKSGESDDYGYEEAA